MQYYVSCLELNRAFLNCPSKQLQYPAINFLWTCSSTELNLPSISSFFVLYLFLSNGFYTLNNTSLPPACNNRHRHNATGTQRGQHTASTTSNVC